MKRTIRYLVASILIVGLLVACSSPNNNNNNDNTNNDNQQELQTFTLEQLAEFDGQNGNPAYVAVDGVVYDVSDVPQWSNGTHQGLTAGSDWTAEINEMSPHGTRVLNNLPIVGELVE